MSSKKDKNLHDSEINTTNADDITSDIPFNEEIENAPADDMSEVEKLKLEVAELNDKLIRNLAEFENYKRRSSKERLDFLKTAAKEVVVEMLPVLDDFERGLETMEKSSDIESLKTGVQLTYNKFKSILTNKGLTPIEATNCKLDTDLHEAISQVPGDAKNKNTIIAEVEKGYKLNDSVIRFSKVIVSV